MDLLRLVVRNHRSNLSNDLRSLATIPEPIIDLAQPLISELANYERSRKLAPIHLLPRAFPAHVVLTSGSGWSGTGAVTAFLHQIDGLAFPFKFYELTALKAPYGAKAIMEAAPSDLRAAVVAFVKGCVLGVPHAPGLSAGLVARNKRFSLLTSVRLKPDAAAALFAATRLLLREVHQDRELALQRFFYIALRTKKAPRGVIYLNNVIHQASIDLSRLLLDATVVAVIRDARDQYVARMREGTSHLTVDDYIATRTRHWKRLTTFMDRFPAAPIHLVRFETFVQSPEERSRLLSLLRMRSEWLVTDTEKFDASVSAMNVGIHRTWANDEIAQIAAALPEQIAN